MKGKIWGNGDELLDQLLHEHLNNKDTVINRSRGDALHVIYILTSYTFIQVRIVSKLASKVSWVSILLAKYTFHKVLSSISSLS